MRHISGVAKRGIAYTFMTRPGECFACRNEATAAADVPAGVVFACDNHRFALLDFDQEVVYQRTSNGSFLNCNGEELSKEREIWDGTRQLYRELRKSFAEGFTR